MILNCSKNFLVRIMNTCQCLIFKNHQFVCDILKHWWSFCWKICFWCKDLILIHSTQADVIVTSTSVKSFGTDGCSAVSKALFEGAGPGLKVYLESISVWWRQSYIYIVLEKKLTWMQQEKSYQTLSRKNKYFPSVSSCFSKGVLFLQSV